MIFDKIRRKDSDQRRNRRTAFSFEGTCCKRCFYTVLRRGRKVAIKNELIKKVVPGLKVSDFNKKELDYNGSGEYIFVFITQEGMKFYIKFKFVFNEGQEKVKFISFHYAELRNA